MENTLYAFNGALNLFNVKNIHLNATTLHVSNTTLQRKLSNEGSSFNDLLNHYKKTKAEQLLRERQLSIKEINFILGYKNERAFFDASQRWLGTSPSAYVANCH